jgi:hypothetical protein
MAFFEDAEKQSVLIDLDAPFDAEKNVLPIQPDSDRAFKRATWLFGVGALLSLAISFLAIYTPLSVWIENLPPEIITLSSFVTAIVLGILINKARMFHENSLEAYKQLIAANDMLLAIIGTVQDTKLRNQLFDVLKYTIFSIFLSVSKTPFRIKVGKKQDSIRTYNPILSKLLLLSKKAGIEKEVGWSSAGLFRLTTARSTLLTNVRFEIRQGYYIIVLLFFFLSHVLISLKIASINFNPWVAAVLMGSLSYGMGVILYVAKHESQPTAVGSRDIDLNRRYQRFISKTDEVNTAVTAMSVQ